jgi:CubicO group peptidase (beta-lactamase class C family)
LAPAASAADTSAPTPAADTVAKQIDGYLTSHLKEAAVPGAAVALTRGDQVVMVRGYGHDSTGAAVTPTSLFRVASLSKSFTALAVMQLVDAGRVNLDDPVLDYVPEFQMADPRAASITVRQLLNQTSGITDAVVPELSRRQPTTVPQAASSLRSYHLATTPGTAWSYANPNYQVAARLVEVVSGEEFNAYQQRHIFTPAHMTSTSATITENDPVPGLADGHLMAYGHPFTAPGFGSFVAGEGGVVSSATDMAQWLIVNANRGRAADGTQLVTQDSAHILHTPSATGSNYALGWTTRGPRTAPTRVEHSGSLFTFTSQEAFWPGTGYGVVLLFNSGSPLAMDQNAIVHGVFDIIEGTTPPSDGPNLTRRADLVLGALTVLALLLGGLGLVRAGSWVRERRGVRVRTALRLLPSALVLTLGAAFPWLAEALIGRDVTWRAAAYEWPALVVFVAATQFAEVVTLAARAWQGFRSRPTTTATAPQMAPAAHRAGARIPVGGTRAG